MSAAVVVMAQVELPGSRIFGVRLSGIDTSVWLESLAVWKASNYGGNNGDGKRWERLFGNQFTQ